MKFDSTTTSGERYGSWAEFLWRLMAPRIMFTCSTKLRPDRAVSDVLRELKASATGWMHDVFPTLKDFFWQRGYGAFTVSHSLVESTRRYIAAQKEIGR